MKKAAQLLFEIKDVRDELNILRTIAEFQRKVQSRMNGRELTATSPILDEDLTAVYVRNDIDEMDKLAGRIKDAVLYSRRHRFIQVLIVELSYIPPSHFTRVKFLWIRERG